MSKYRAVVFDWEGTLSDSYATIFHCIREEAARLELGDFQIDQAYQFVHLGLLKALHKLFPHLTSSQENELVIAVQQALKQKHAEVHLIPGAKKLIQALHEQGIRLAIASNKGTQGLYRAVHQAGLDTYFSSIKSAGMLAPKPSPEMLDEILQEWNLSNTDVLMIGDSLNDIEMARTLHVDVIAVNFYDATGDDLLSSGALHVFHDYVAVANFLGIVL